MLQITRYHKTRFWALWDGSELVAVVVYKKGGVVSKNFAFTSTTEAAAKASEIAAAAKAVVQ